MGSTWSGWKKSQTKSTRLFDRSMLGGDVLRLLRTLHWIAILTLLLRRTIELAAAIVL